MKKLSWLVILALTLSTATMTSLIHGGNLTDFTKTGMTFVEKSLNGQVLVDLTPLFRVSGYSSQNPETKEFSFEALVIPPEKFN